MRQEGYPLSALFGISDFYPKFGYAPALVECSTELATRYAERASARFDVREARPEDAPAIAAIYQQTRAYRTASISRDPASWRGFRRGTHWDERGGCFLVVDGERLLGYAAHDLKDLDDPEGLFGEGDKIHIIARQGFSDDNPAVAGWLSNFKMDDDSLATLSRAVIDEFGEGRETEAIEAWLAEPDNQALVDGWLGR